MSGPRGRRAPKRSLGQNFLVDGTIARRIVDASSVAAGDTVLEIGPGRGALTGLLEPLGRPLVLLEKDDGLIRQLRRRYAGHSHVALVHGDAMTEDLDALPGDRPVKVVANLPYNIASRIALRVLAWDGLRDATFMFQREVALRFAAEPGSRTYGGLSILARVWADPFLLFPVVPAAFRPRPKVDSAVVRFLRLDQPRVPRDELPDFEQLVRGVFQHRRKTLVNSVQQIPGFEGSADSVRALLERLEIDPTRRPETLSLEEFLTLHRSVAGRES